MTEVIRRPLEAVRGSWDELVSAALIGTERRAFVPDPAVPAAADPARALLRQAALAAVPMLAGAQPARYQGPLPEPAPPDERPLVPCAAQLRLQTVLAVRSTELAEFLAVVRASGRRLPAAAMPGLLDAGRSDVSIRGALAAVLGARGHWLARQNADWRYLLREPFGPLRPEDWDGPDPDARIAYANGLYAADPAAARVLVQAAWPTLTAAVKMQLLGLVARHGTKADLPFVEGLSQDSSKQVREEVNGLVAQLKQRGDDAPALSGEQFAADVERLAAAADAGNAVYQFAMQHARRRWPPEGARAILAVLAELGREEVSGSDQRGDRAAESLRNRNRWAAGQLMRMLADCAPLELLPDAERLVQARHDDLAAGLDHHLDFGDLLATLAFRADMHAELTASADAVPGQE